MEAEAFAQELRPLLPRSGGYAQAMLHDRGEAEDAVQQAALQAWQRREQYDSGRPFQGWWFAILRNYCLDELRRRRRAPAGTDYASSGLSVPADESAVERLDLAAAIEGLPEGQREVLRLRYFGDLTYDELAQALAIPVGTVMSRLHLARKALAATLQLEE